MREGIEGLMKRQDCWVAIGLRSDFMVELIQLSMDGKAYCDEGVTLLIRETLPMKSPFVAFVQHILDSECEQCIDAAVTAWGCSYGKASDEVIGRIIKMDPSLRKLKPFVEKQVVAVGA